MAESLEMLRVAAASGTTDIVATPHANAQFAFDWEQVQRLGRDLSEQAQGSIRIHLGCDFHLNYSNLTDAVRNPAKYTINGNSYLLVELPDFVALPTARQSLLQLLKCGTVPIVTHPERNLSLQKSFKELKLWAKDGCLFQITAQSIYGHFGVVAQGSAITLLNANLVHFIASDGHDPSVRPPDLSQAYHYVTKHYGQNHANSLFFKNPSAVITGRSLPPLSNPNWLNRLLRRG